MRAPGGAWRRRALLLAAALLLLCLASYADAAGARKATPVSTGGSNRAAGKVAPALASALAAAKAKAKALGKGAKAAAKGVGGAAKEAVKAAANKPAKAAKDLAAAAAKPSAAALKAAAKAAAAAAAAAAAQEAEAAAGAAAAAAAPAEPAAEEAAAAEPPAGEPAVGGETAVVVEVSAAEEKAAIADAIAHLGKADDKQTEKAFKDVQEAPEGGVRLIKNILTGKLAPAVDGEAANAAAAEEAEAEGLPAPAAVPEVSAVAAAALATATEAGAAPVVAVAGAPVAAATERAEHVVDVVAGHAKGGGGASKEFHAKDARPMRVHLGSAMATPDIVRDGQLLPAWNISERSSEADVRLSSVPANVDFVDFFLWRTHTAGDKARRVITAQKPFVMCNDSEVMDAHVGQWGPRHMAPVPLANVSETLLATPGAGKPTKQNELLFGVQFECRREGTALVTVVLRLFELTTGQRGSESLQWSFLKRCHKPSAKAAAEGTEANAEGNVAIAGLAVGTRFNTSDVVAHGEALPTWTLGSGAASSLHVFGTEVEGAKWWMRYDAPVTDANLTVNKAVFLVDDPTVLLVEESGELTEQFTTLRAGRSFTLSVTFTCKRAGSTSVSVAFAVPQLGSKISFAFQKQCAGLVVGDGATMNGIDIWQDQNDAARKPEVVENGVVQPEWRPIQNLTHEADTVRPAGADADTKHISFFVKLRKGYHDVEYETPLVESYSASGEVIVRPKVFGSIQEASKLVAGQARFLVLEFNCIKEGDAVVTVKLPFRPTGSLQFNLRKTCSVATEEEQQAAAEVKEYSTGDTLTPLPGIHVGHWLDSSSVVRNGIPSPAYHVDTSVDGLMPVGKKYPWINFFLWKDASVADAKDVRFGRPELISTADIARPVISGLGAEGGILTDNEYSSLSVTFHCFTAGNTTVTLSIPLVGDEWLNAEQEPVRIAPARADPIKISFVKECPLATEEPVIGMGGVGISGFSIGLSPNSSEMVFNGFPQPHYFGQRAKLRPDWDDVIVPANAEALTMHIHYNSRSGENQLVGKEVMFQAPVVVSHDSIARPALGGDAASGGLLARDGPALPLDVTFNCRYAGLAVVTVIVPIVPHGQVSITIPKRCEGDAAPHGLKVSGLHVGTTPTGSEVVLDGQTRAAYVSYATKKRQEHKVRAHEDRTVFYLRKEGEPLRALEPLLYVHKPIVNVRVTHRLSLNATAPDAGAVATAQSDEIELNAESGQLVLEYACVHAGKTDITLSLNMLPKGQLQWTFEKQCEDVTGDAAAVEEQDALLNSMSVRPPLRAPAEAGISPGGSPDIDAEYERYRRMGASDTSSYAAGHAPFGAGAHTHYEAEASSWWDDEDGLERPRPLGPASIGGGVVGDSAVKHNRPSSSAALPGPKQPAEASIMPSDSVWDNWRRSAAYNPHTALDHSEPEVRALVREAATGTATLQIGTGKEGESASDVFSRSLPSPRYQMKNKASLDITHYAVVKPDQESSTFYLSSTSPNGQSIGKPSVVLEKKFAQFLAPTLAGPAAVGGQLQGAGVVGATPLRLELHYRCERGGVFAVGVRVPVGDQVALFRVIKICPNYEIHEEFYWTAGRVMSVIGLVAAIVALAGGFIFMRRIFQQKKTLANAMYVPVQTEQS